MAGSTTLEGRWQTGACGRGFLKRRSAIGKCGGGRLRGTRKPQRVLLFPRLRDGPKTVYSTSLEEAKNEAQTPLLVNINTADAKELDELPGVGPSTAKSIVEHRRHRGSFKSVEELEDVSGIGPKTLEKIRPFATV